ncbi:E3 ubiquitin-protein ligase RNF8-like [Drosophila biarmipes]|uniref:E3 ubiquitin-protein ligase RNF8-like n=1 Tax=Drosophila biarmipes TaxID=125945 RepID=UPI0007E64CF2|nr:E3 ubiquitin-protein ligase RNF8-like [Drosophila biarmipes]
MNPGSSRRGASDCDASLSQQMKQNIRKMNDLVRELQEEKHKVSGLQQENSGRKRQLEESNATLEKRVRELEHLNAQLEQFNSEREGILLQLQEEMSNYATIQEKFREQEQSMQMIVRELEDERLELLDELAVKDIMSADSINDLSEEVNELNEQLNGRSDDITCSICISPLESEGGHRVVSLRCGHLFGQNCIRTALRRSRQCPICLKRAHPADVRKIYGHGILPS